MTVCTARKDVVCIYRCSAVPFHSFERERERDFFILSHSRHSFDSVMRRPFGLEYNIRQLSSRFGAKPRKNGENFYRY